MCKSEFDELAELFELLYKHGQGVLEREIAHTINNHLSALSMQINMLLRAINQRNQTLAIRKADEIQETSQRIQDYARSLSISGLAPGTIEKVKLSHLISGIVHFAHATSGLSQLEINVPEPAEESRVKCQSSGIKLLLVSFLYSASQISVSAAVNIAITKLDGISTVSAHLINPKREGLKFLTQLHKAPGALPMRQLKRTLEADASDLKIDLLEGAELGLKCHITTRE